VGFGGYSLEAHKAITESRAEIPREQVFTRNDCDPRMNPRGVKFRESRDSAAHPNTVGIVFALDVSGSMEDIPHTLATKTLPTFMEAVLPALPDAQVLFMAFGNAYSDKSPLQVGQFESEAPLIDQWLSTAHLEGGGGGLGESYDLAMWFASRHTAMDCLQKRGKKGYFFMTGDETPFLQVNPEQVKGLIGDVVPNKPYVHDVVAELQQTFHVFFLIPDQARADRELCGRVWKHLLHEACVVLERSEDTAVVCALLIGITEKQLPDEAAIRAQLAKLGRSGKEADRVVDVVLPYAKAVANGGLPAPGKLVLRTDPGSIKG
jgi:hypothetical protein